jgi:hypothetical protein
MQSDAEHQENDANLSELDRQMLIGNDQHHFQSNRMRRYELAFGQVLGTNFINLSLIFLADAVFAGGAVMNEHGRFGTVSALLGTAIIGIMLVGLLERRNKTIMRMEYDSLTGHRPSSGIEVAVPIRAKPTMPVPSPV